MAGDQPHPDTPGSPTGTTSEADRGGAAAPLNTDDILASAGEAAYRWDIASDHLVWSANAGEVLRIAEPATISSGRAYARLIDGNGGESRFDAVLRAKERDQGHGVSYQIEYRIRPDARAETMFWIEDCGRWFAGADGRPARAQGTVRIIDARHEREQHLSLLARCDELTGEPNRRHLTETLQKTLDEATRFRSSCGFFLVAIDHLARINKSYGFDIADAAIAALAKRMRALTRGKDTLGRYSGNKFGIVLCDCTPDDMKVAAERLLAGVRDELIPTSAGPIAMTVSIGGVIAPRHAQTVAEILARAEEALAAAKRTGRGSFLAYRPNIEREAQRRENVRSTDEIVAALNERRIFLAYEPVVSARERQPAFYECLMRVRRSDGGLLGANDIVPVAERLGLVRLLDHRVLELVIEEMAAAPSLKASVNASPGSTTDPDWWAGLEFAVARARGNCRAPDHRNHRERRDQRRRFYPRLCRARQGSRLPHRHRRFRRRLHLVPQPAQARRRYGQDRRRLRAEHAALGGRSRLRAHAGRARPQAQSRHCRRVGAGRGHGKALGRVGLRFSARRAGRACHHGTAVAHRAAAERGSPTRVSGAYGSAQKRAPLRPHGHFANQPLRRPVELHLAL